MDDEALVDLHGVYLGGQFGVWTPHHEDYAFTGMVETGHTVESYHGQGFNARLRVIEDELRTRGIDPWEL